MALDEGPALIWPSLLLWHIPIRAARRPCGRTGGMVRRRQPARLRTFLETAFGSWFFGHSGGGALAVCWHPLPETDAVATLQSDIDAWTGHHGYSPLAGSLNPAEFRERGSNIIISRLTASYRLPLRAHRQTAAPRASFVLRTSTTGAAGRTRRTFCNEPPTRFELHKSLEIECYSFKPFRQYISGETADMKPLRKKSLGLAISTTLLIGCVSQPVDRGEMARAVEGYIEDVDKLFVVDCLLPGQVRKLGSQMTYLSARRPIRTTAADCEVRGGEYVAYDRANYSSALNVWLPKAQEGDATAQLYVGQIYEKGLGQAPDYRKAAEWYRKAAEKGNAQAQINLGHLYEKGSGVPKDNAAAARWYQGSGTRRQRIEFHPGDRGFRSTTSGIGDPSPGRRAQPPRSGRTPQRTERHSATTAGATGHAT